MKFRSLFITLLASVVVSNKSVAQSFPAICDAAFDIYETENEVNDTVYACLGTPLTFDDTSELDGTLSQRDWVFGDGDTELNALQLPGTTHYYAEEGTYTATLTVGSDECPATTVTKTIIVLGEPDYYESTVDVDCYGNCNGEAFIDIQSQNDSLYYVDWYDDAGEGMFRDVIIVPGNGAIGLCAGDYTAVINDYYGCTSMSDISITIYEPNELVATIDQGATLGLCPADGVTDISLTVDGGDENYQITWEASPFITEINSHLVKFTPTSQSLDVMYSVFVEDGNGCWADNSIYIYSLPSTLSGSVSVGSDPCATCTVIQYHYSTDVGLWSPLNTTTTDNFGNYDFGPIANFLPFTIMADPVNYPLAVPTFYPQGHLWNTATVLTDVCGQTFDKDINIPEPMNFNGSNIFDGTVYYSQSGKMETDEDPIPLIDVVVEKTPPGQAQGKQTTNSNGGYTFVLVPSSDTIYTLFVSMPGIPVNSTYEIMADQGNQTFYHLDFCLAPDSSAIDICNLETAVINNAIESNEKSFVMYPNPNNGRFAIETGRFAETESELRIIDTIGRVIFKKRYAQTPSTINMVNIAEGYYMVQLINDREADSSPINVMRY